MTLTPSNMVELGTDAIDFNIIDVVSDTNLNLTNYAKNRPIVLAFICNHCPYVKHIIDKLAIIGNEYSKKGFAFIAISSNDIDNYPEDSPEKMRALSSLKGFYFPYCYDSTQAVAKQYNAACTPDFFCYNQEHKLVYRGRFDGATPGNSQSVTGEDLILAMNAILAINNMPLIQKPSMGCNIKWKSHSNII